jgi:hypothetical protein
MRALSFAAGFLSILSVTAAQEAVPAPTSKISDEEMWKALREHLPFDISGGFLLWHYHPFLDNVDDNTELYYANLVIDGHYDQFGIHFEPRFRDTKLRPYYTSNIWVQEMYMSWKPFEDSDGMLKVGKVYSQFGRFWDGVFYGNIPYFDGLKLDPDIGLSWESKLHLGDSTTVDYSAQFFDEDGSTNGSLRAGTRSIGKNATCSSRGRADLRRATGLRDRGRLAMRRGRSRENAELHACERRGVPHDRTVHGLRRLHAPERHPRPGLPGRRIELERHRLPDVGRESHLRRLDLPRELQLRGLQRRGRQGGAVAPRRRMAVPPPPRPVVRVRLLDA